MRRRTFLLGLTGAGASSLLARAQQPNHVTVTPDEPTFQPLAIDGGGFLRGMDIHADGTMVVRADTYGAYVGSVTPGTKWTQLMTIRSMPANSVGFDLSHNFMPLNDAAPWDIRIAHNNSSIFYMMYGGKVFKTTNKGTSWAQTSLSGITWPPFESNNRGSSQNQQKLAIDPNNANVVLAGTPTNGLWVTVDGGNSWTQTSGVPASEAAKNGDHPGVTGIAFDPSSGATGGLTNTVYAVAFGHGVYRSTTGANGTWSHLSDSPTYVDSAIVAGGAYYCAAGMDPSGGSTTIQKYSSGSWSTIRTDTDNGIHALAVNPNNPSNIVYSSYSGQLTQTSDGGTSWITYPTISVSASDVPYLTKTPANGNWLTTGQIMFDPLTPNKLWQSTGVGVWYTTSLTETSSGSTRVAWNSQTLGIQQLVAKAIISPPGGNPIVSCMDRQQFTVASPTTQPSDYGISQKDLIVAGWSVDWASASPSTIVALNNWFGRDDSGYSSDGGSTWHLFASPPTGSGRIWSGGQIAASTSTNFCVLPGRDAASIYYTTNGGSSWSAAIGLPTTGWPTSAYNDTRVLCADRVAPNTFYAFNKAGTYKSIDGGATWSLVNPLVKDASYYLNILASVPGNAGHLFLTLGFLNGPGPHPDSSRGFYRSTSGGMTWTAVHNVREVWAVGFGAIASGRTYPTVWIVGWVKVSSNPHKYGVWVSKDNCESWTWLIDYPFGSWDLPVCMTGDSNDASKCYIGYQGSGWVRGFNLSY